MEFNAETKLFLLGMALAPLLITGVLIGLGIRLVRSGQSSRGAALFGSIVAWFAGPFLMTWLSRYPLAAVLAFSTAWLLSASLLWYVGFGPEKRWLSLTALPAISTCLAFDVLLKHLRPFGADEDLSALVGVLLGVGVSVVAIAKCRRAHRRGAAQQAVEPVRPAAGTS